MNIEYRISNIEYRIMNIEYRYSLFVNQYHFRKVFVGIQFFPNFMQMNIYHGKSDPGL